MNRKKKPTEEVKMSTWEVFRRLVRDARPIYGWLLLGALLGGMVVACTVIAPKLLGQGIQLLYDASGRTAQSRSDRSAAADLRSTGGGVPAEEYRGHRKDGPDQQCGE